MKCVVNVLFLSLLTQTVGFKIPFGGSGCKSLCSVTGILRLYLNVSPPYTESLTRIKENKLKLRS